MCLFHRRFKSSAILSGTNDSVHYCNSPSWWRIHHQHATDLIKIFHITFVSNRRSKILIFSSACFFFSNFPPFSNSAKRQLPLPIRLEFGARSNRRNLIKIASPPFFICVKKIMQRKFWSIEIFFLWSSSIWVNHSRKLVSRIGFSCPKLEEQLENSWGTSSVNLKHCCRTSWALLLKSRSIFVALLVHCC